MSENHLIMDPMFLRMMIMIFIYSLTLLLLQAVKIPAKTLPLWIVGVRPHVTAAPCRAAAGRASICHSGGLRAKQSVLWPAHCYHGHRQPAHGS